MIRGLLWVSEHTLDQELYYVNLKFLKKLVVVVIVTTTSFVYFANRYLKNVKFRMYNKIEAINIPKLTTPIPIPTQLPITNETANIRKEIINVKCVALIAFFLKIYKETKNIPMLIAKPKNIGVKILSFINITSFIIIVCFIKLYVIHFNPPNKFIFSLISWQMYTGFCFQ